MPSSVWPVQHRLERCDKAVDHRLRVGPTREPAHIVLPAGIESWCDGVHFGRKVAVKRPHRHARSLCSRSNCRLDIPVLGEHVQRRVGDGEHRTLLTSLTPVQRCAHVGRVLRVGRLCHQEQRLPYATAPPGRPCASHSTATAIPGRTRLMVIQNRADWDPSSPAHGGLGCDSISAGLRNLLVVDTECRSTSSAP